MGIPCWKLSFNSFCSTARDTACSSSPFHRLEINKWKSPNFTIAVLWQLVILVCRTSDFTHENDNYSVYIYDYSCYLIALPVYVCKNILLKNGSKCIFMWSMYMCTWIFKEMCACLLINEYKRFHYVCSWCHGFGTLFTLLDLKPKCILTM